MSDLVGFRRSYRRRQVIAQGESKYRDQRADDLRALYHAIYGGEEIAVPVEAIAEDLLGLGVHEVPLQRCLWAALSVRRVVFLNANDTPAPRCFTPAHEVGHCVCQFRVGRGEPLKCRAKDVAPGTDRTLEREDNIFAGELLMPEPAVRAAASDLELATRFAVSDGAIRWRLYGFGLGSKP
jgi:hypothetical protein